MRILQIIPTLEPAGAEVMCLTLASELKNLGHDVEIICLYHTESFLVQKARALGISVYFLEKKKGLDVSIIVPLRKLIKQIKPDVIHTHLDSINYVLISSIGISCKKLHTIHTVANKEAGGIVAKIREIFFKEKSVVPVGLNETISKSIKLYYNLNYDVPFVNNGIDLSKCAKKEEYTVYESFKLINVARFSEQKNHRELILGFAKALQSIDNIQLTLVGVGPLEKEIRGLVKEMGLEEEVIFYGPADDVYKLLRDSDAFILPSLYEGMPITIVEAMGSALPIIASNVGGVGEMITNEYNGLLCSPTADSIAECIAKFYFDGILRKNCGQNGYSSAIEKFSSKKMARDYELLYLSE